jgi:hypothetical protein
MLILSAVKKYLKSPFSQKRNRNDLEDGISKSTFPFGSRLHITWPRMIQVRQVTWEKCVLLPIIY